MKLEPVVQWLGLRAITKDTVASLVGEVRSLTSGGRGGKNLWDFPGASDAKERAFSAGDPALIPGLGRSPGEGSGNPLQSSCLENPMDRGAWWAAVLRVMKSWTPLSD